MKQKREKKSFYPDLSNPPENCSSPHVLSAKIKEFPQETGTPASITPFEKKYTIIRLPVVLAESGPSRSTLYQHISQGLWTKPVRIGERAVGWPAHEVSALNAARIAGKTDDEIRALVVTLEAARKSVI